MYFRKGSIETNDMLIREALVERLKGQYESDPEYRIIPELGIWHGAARIDVAVINGILHGFEIKSDRDTLYRLPRQMGAYNSVFDNVTLVVGSAHFIDAFKMVPDWWGIETAHVRRDGSVFFNEIRRAEDNPELDSISIARLLWRQQALELLEREGKAEGFRSKSRDAVYERIAESVDLKDLRAYVRSVLQESRKDWRSDVLPA